MASQYAIETISLSKAFKDWWGRTRVLAVDELNLRIEHNEVYGLLGPNGSGKSTTIKMLLSLLHPTSGKAFILGGLSSEPRISERVGFLPEESYLYKYLSARETLNFYGNLFGIAPKVLEMRIDSLLDMVGLSSVANRPVGTFSKGMQRRIGLAQALINDPDVLILDEPTSGLDPIGTRQIKDLIKHLADRGKTVLMCSHLLADVEDVCDRVCVLYGGKVQCEGSVKDLLKQTDKCQILTDNVSDETIKKVREIIEKSGAKCEISSPTFRLEELFINIVTEAQNNKVVTGGAHSSRKIGDFLGGEKKQEQTGSEKVLEQLVSAKLEKAAPEPSDTDAVASKTERKSVPADETKVDGEILSGLVGAQQKSGADVEVDSVESIPEPAEQVKDDLLKKLMGDSDA
ncbi:MAG: ABC transporter ATP-binding protein [Phycisphaerae bacterium]